jgi:hypothetical protein
MKKLKITAKLVVMFILLAVLVFTTMAVAQRLVPGGAANAGKGEWVVMTYVPDNNYSVPVPLPVVYPLISIPPLTAPCS